MNKKKVVHLLFFLKNAQYQSFKFDFSKYFYGIHRFARKTLQKSSIIYTKIKGGHLL